MYEVRAPFTGGDRTIFKTEDVELAKTEAREYAIHNGNSFYAEGAGVDEIREGVCNGVPYFNRFLVAYYDADGEDVTAEVREGMAEHAYE